MNKRSRSLLLQLTILRLERAGVIDLKDYEHIKPAELLAIREAVHDAHLQEIRIAWEKIKKKLKKNWRKLFGDE